MFKNEFQGGSYVEVFSAQGRDPVAKWRLSGSASTKSKVYDKDVKSFVYVLEGETTTTKMTLPKDEKQSLWLIQRYLIVQLFVPLGHSFSLEFGVTDTASNKRRILLSSNHREVIVTHLHARFPLNILRFGVWLNLCLDLNSLVGETFKGQSFKALENLTISASCRLRKIFTMKVQPIDTTDDEQIYGRENAISREVENIPKALQFSSSPDLQHYTQVINMAKLRQAEAKAREVAGLPPPTTPILLESDPASKAGEQPTHIAFGSKVVIPKHARKSSREGGTGSAGSRSSSGLNHSGSIPHLRTASPAAEEDSGRESSRQTHGLYYQRSLSDATDSRTEPLKSRLEVEATQSTMQPRPPRTGSGGRTRRRPLRVRNPGVTKSHTVDDKIVNSAGIKAEVNVNCAKSTVISEKELDNNAETISRSQSETSLKMSGNNDSLGESFSYLQSNNVKREDQNGHANTSTDQSMIATKTSNDSPPQPVFTFSSRPRSAPRSPRNRQRKPQDSVVQGKTPSDEKPDIQVYMHEPVKIGESKSKADKVRTRRESERSEYDDDFYKASGESSGEEDDWQKLLKTSGNSRCSSRGSRMSPVPGSQTSGSPESDPLSNSQILRMSIRSSLLKEIPSPRKNNTKPYEAKNYQSDASSWRNFESNASSWRFDTSVISNNMLDRSCGKSFSGSYGHDSGFPRERFMSSRTSGSEDGIVTNDGGDSLSDSSDDTSYSTWKGPPPPDKRQHRYLDEMRHPGPEPDLSATLPMDPREYSNVFSPPIVLPSQRIGSGQKTTTLSAAAALSPPRSRNVSTSADHDSVSAEEELDLLYDPCLNCYFDPTTHKYYELA